MFKTVTLNTAAQILSRLTSSFLAFLITVLLARTLGITLFGEYTKATSYIMLFYLVVDFGINAIFIQKTGNNDTRLRGLFPSFFGLRLTIGFVVALLSVGGAYLLSLVNPGFNSLVLTSITIASLSMIAYALELSATAIFQAKSRYDLAMIVDVVGPMAMLALLLFGLPKISDPRLLVLYPVLTLSVNVFVGALVGLVLVRGFVTALPRLAATDWSTLFKQSLPLGVVLILNVLYFRIDILILSQYRTSAEIGAYSLAYKFFEFGIAIPTFLLNSLYPLIVPLSAKLQFQKLLQSAGVLAAFSLLVMLGAYFLAPLMVLIKPEYLPSVSLLRLLIVSLPIFYLSSPLMWWFILKNKHHQLVPVYAVGVVVNVLLNWYFVPLYGAAASALITGVTELTVLVIGVSMMKPLMNSK